MTAPLATRFVVRLVSRKVKGSYWYVTSQVVAGLAGGGVIVGSL